MMLVSNILVGGLFAGLATAQTDSQLPVVDLGYQLQRASAFDGEHQLYSFSNIRYAAPPTGNLRWRPPQTPETDRTNVDDGSTVRICPQGHPQWQGLTTDFLTSYVTGRHYTPPPKTSWNTTFSDPPRDPHESEDCLFLDVFVPKQIFDQAGKTYGAPVLVWIFGGGYIEGSKDSYGSPVGLIERSLAPPTSEGVIYVAMNYRLGAFGFSAGPTVQSDGTANLGLHDQRFALEWVQNNIAKFGGDPKRVTVFGQSAGAGSIMHQITAYGGKQGPSPFQQAVIESPGWFFRPSSSAQDSVFKEFLSRANLSSLEEARQAPTESLIIANAEQIGLTQDYGFFTYTPVVDGDFVPSGPPQLLQRGQYDQNVRVLTGQVSHEGWYNTSPYVKTEEDQEAWLTSSLPFATPKVREYIRTELYPPVFDGSYPYTDQTSRNALIIAESIFTCNSQYLHRAYNNETYGYFFSIPPGLHGADMPYLYYNGDTSINAKVAATVQEWVTSFATQGYPTGLEGGAKFEQYGSDANVVEINDTAIVNIKDPQKTERCQWWQEGLYW